MIPTIYRKMCNNENTEDSQVPIIPPEVGVILIVTIAIALVSLVVIMVLGIGGDTSESADIDVYTELDNDDSELDVVVFQNRNVQNLESTVGSLDIISGVGDLGAGSIDVSNYERSSVTIVAVVEGGYNKEVVATADIPSNVGGSS